MDNLAYSNIEDDTPSPPPQQSQEEYEMDLRHQDQMARAGLGESSTRQMNYIARQESDSVAPEAVTQEAPEAPQPEPIQEAPEATGAQKAPEAKDPGNSFWGRQWKLLKSIVCCNCKSSCF
ncbi:hypothetical protein GCK72_021351 [Caenorhabditis remanei]|uniref:Uncharacterized protein n=1 Tax=Caenorhabditis remanei TaxID=31234 RepID=A0A6A5GHW7_CAERE|nr:hypothetical protein GCK72_021351 [Caenorhabditis remanei]KAF1754787.1 hypothetical protein GCK72_021351 [Caenorhabditis remanei]